MAIAGLDQQFLAEDVLGGILFLKLLREGLPYFFQLDEKMPVTVHIPFLLWIDHKNLPSTKPILAIRHIPIFRDKRRPCPYRLYRSTLHCFALILPTISCSSWLKRSSSLRRLAIYGSSRLTRTVNSGSFGHPITRSHHSRPVIQRFPWIWAICWVGALPLSRSSISRSGSVDLISSMPSTPTRPSGLHPVAIIFDLRKPTCSISTS